MGIHDVYKGQQAGVAVGGKIEAGFVSVGDKVSFIVYLLSALKN